MNDDKIAQVLKALPRQQASDRFTPGVLARLDGERSQRTTPRWMVVAATTAIVALALGFGWRDWHGYHERQEARSRFELLLAEKQALEAELRSLRQLADQAQPVIYLGGNERVDLVLDLARLQRSGGLRTDFESPGEVRPAELRSGQPATIRNVVY